MNNCTKLTNNLRHAQPRFKAQYPTLHPTCTAKEIARDPATITNADPRLAPTSPSGGATYGGSTGQRSSPVIGSLEKKTKQKTQNEITNQ